MSDLQPPKRYTPQKSDKIVKHKTLRFKRFFNSDLFAVGGFDIPFFLLTMTLLTIGIIMLFSASYPYAYQKFGDSYYFLKRQLLFAGIGFVLMLIVSKINFKTWKALERLLLACSILLLIVVLFYHTDVDGGFKRWMRIGPITLQPSDIAKFALIVSMSAYVSKYYNKMKKPIYGIVIPILLIGVFCVLIALEHHLSCTILVFLIGATIMFVGGTDWKLFALGAGVIVAVVVVVILNPNVLLDYNAERITAWLDKSFEPLGARWQTNNSLYAIGSGGFWGVGLGNSKQKYLYVSEPQNDFIFAIVCEELGLVKVIGILVLFALLFYQGIKIAIRVNDRFGSLMVIGIVSQIAIQTIFNVLVVTDTIPNTGIALPFFSSGGSAIIMLMIECGVVLSVSRKANQKTV